MIGPDRDIPGPDLGTNATIMGWMADEYAGVVGHWAPGVVTGKPIPLGGSLGREDATARGGFYLLQYLANNFGVTSGSRVAIQGIGNAGMHMARLLGEAGYRIVAVSDSRQGLVCAEGLDLEAVRRAKASGGLASLVGANGIKGCKPSELVHAECDILIPAAVENVIRADNVAGVRARLILELANGPVAPDADANLSERGVIVLPDILANSGGVTVSYFEWAQNRQGVSWPLSDVQARLRKSMEEEGGAVLALSREKGRFAAPRGLRPRAEADRRGNRGDRDGNLTEALSQRLRGGLRHAHGCSPPILFASRLIAWLCARSSRGRICASRYARRAPEFPKAGFG